MNITVYLGSNYGNDEKFKRAITELGTFIGSRGDTLVYGGSKEGLMGVLADTVMAAGGYVIGVELKLFIELNYQHNGLNEMIVADDMRSRRAKMAELGDAFIAFPGGTGTLEEITEIMSHTTLDLVDASCILYNLDGYYDGLKELLNTMISFDFSTEARQKNIHFAESLSEIEEILAEVK